MEQNCLLWKAGQHGKQNNEGQGRSGRRDEEMEKNTRKLQMKY